MKKQFSRYAITCILLAVSIAAISQSKDEKKYKEQADAIRAEVWGWKKPQFAVREIPAEYAGASKVIIARHTQIVADSKMHFGEAAYPQQYVTEIIREVVKINDKASIAEYSEISYTKFTKKSNWRTSGVYYRYNTNTFIGVHVIKPDGTVKEINADDNVMTKDEKTSQEYKLAIAELEVGDIVDYYVATQKKIDDQHPSDVWSDLFFLFDDAPVLFYSVHGETGKNYSIEYRCYNHAPEFKTSKADDDGNVFDMLIKNIPAYSDGGLWISPLRQLPLIRLNIKKGYIAYYSSRKKEPQVYANLPASGWVDQMKEGANNSYADITSYYIANSLPDDMTKRYADLVKNKDKLPADSVLAELYYTFRYWWFLDVSANDRIDAVVNGTNSNRTPGGPLWSFRSLLLEKKRDVNLKFDTPRSGPRYDEIFEVSDLDVVVAVPTGIVGKNLFGISDMFSPAFYIPEEMEKTNGAMPATEPTGYLFTGSTASQNKWVETIDLTPAGTDLQVSRRTVLQGHYKEDIQRKLILVEDYINSERKLLGAENTIIEQLADAKKKKKSYAPELQAAFDKARTKQKDNFISEAKSWFDQPVTNMTDYKVEKLGVRHTDPDFIYSSKFNLEGAIKKAGNNMIIDIGKLEGSQLKISADQRKRKLDIYQSFARSLQWTITLQIPDGYTAEGINELNKKVENETGYFISEATSDGKAVTINVKKSYNHAYEPAANWEKMLAFIDAANEWNNAKILLKKK